MIHGRLIHYSTLVTVTIAGEFLPDGLGTLFNGGPNGFQMIYHYNNNK